MRHPVLAPSRQSPSHDPHPRQCPCLPHDRHRTQDSQRIDHVKCHVSKENGAMSKEAAPASGLHACSPQPAGVATWRGNVCSICFSEAGMVMNQAIRMVMNQAIPCLAYAPTAPKRFRTHCCRYNSIGEASRLGSSPALASPHRHAHRSKARCRCKTTEALFHRVPENCVSWLGWLFDQPPTSAGTKL